MNTIAKITICAAVALFVACAGEPMPFESKNERLFPNNDMVCMCFEDNKLVKEYNTAFNVIQESTTRFANHMSDSRFVNNTSDSYFNTMEFKNYYSNVIESIPWGADLSYTPMLLRESITRTPQRGRE